MNILTYTDHASELNPLKTNANFAHVYAINLNLMLLSTLAMECQGQILYYK